MKKQLSRREAIQQAAGVGLGVASIFTGQAGRAQSTAKAVPQNADLCADRSAQTTPEAPGDAGKEASRTRDDLKFPTGF